jgi:hypothetical protein
MEGDMLPLPRQESPKADSPCHKFPRKRSQLSSGEEFSDKETDIKEATTLSTSSSSSSEDKRAKLTGSHPAYNVNQTIWTSLISAQFLVIKPFLTQMARRNRTLEHSEDLLRNRVTCLVNTQGLSKSICSTLDITDSIASTTLNEAIGAAKTLIEAALKKLIATDKDDTQRLLDAAQQAAVTEFESMEELYIGGQTGAEFSKGQQWFTADLRTAQRELDHKIKEEQDLIQDALLKAHIQARAQHRLPPREQTNDQRPMSSMTQKASTPRGNLYPEAPRYRQDTPPHRKHVTSYNRTPYTRHDRANHATSDQRGFKPTPRK